MGLDGEPLLVGKDVALALGYTNPQKAIRDHVDDEDKTVNETFRRQRDTDCTYQRKRPVFPRPFQQASRGQEVQALGDE